MKLSQLRESNVPFLYQYTLDKIISDGKITNGTQVGIIGGLAKLFSQGSPWRLPRDYNGYEMITSADDIDAINAMSSSELVSAAKKILAKLEEISSYEDNPYGECEGKTPSEVLQYIARKND